MSNRMHMMIVAGGSGGHVFPGIAIAQQFSRLSDNHRITFLGTEKGMESTLLPALGWTLELVCANKYKLKGQGLVGKLQTMIKLPKSILKSMAIIRSDPPDFILSIGGYAAGPVALAAAILRVPLYLVEPNAIPGLSNRLVSKFAKIVFTAFDEAKEYFKNNNIKCIGNPVRTEIWDRLNSPYQMQMPLTILVFGGSQGARRINQSIKNALPLLSDYSQSIKFIHQTGCSKDTRELREAYHQYGFEATVSDFIECMWNGYEQAHLVIARSGAGTIAELKVIKRPSLLIPYPHAADNHQLANARALDAIGAAITISDYEFDEHCVTMYLKRFVDNNDELQKMHAAFSKCKLEHASKVIVQECVFNEKKER